MEIMFYLNQLQNSRFAGIEDSGDRIQNKYNQLTTTVLYGEKTLNSDY